MKKIVSSLFLLKFLLIFVYQPFTNISTHANLNNVEHVFQNKGKEISIVDLNTDPNLFRQVIQIKTMNFILIFCLRNTII